MSRRICFIFAASLALAGCDLASKQEEHYDDTRNPHYRQAEQDLENNNPAAAANDYEAALGADPKLAGAHYQLGIIYGEKLNDPIGAIFHFKRYLELAPNSDQADKVKDLIDKQSQAFAAGLSNSPTQSADDYAKLQADNASLKKQVDDAAHTIAQLQAQLAQAGKHHAVAAGTAPASSASSPATPAGPVAADNNATNAPASGTGVATATPSPTNATNAAPAGPLRALPLDAPNPNIPAAGADAGPNRTYTVVKGDSIWKIAHKMYPGDTKNGEDKIREANKDVFNGKFLQPGQVLVIPQ